MKTTLTLVIVALSFVLGAVAERVTSAPHCPTEDSCQIDYHNGAWTITEVTP